MFPSRSCVFLVLLFALAVYSGAARGSDADPKRPSSQVPVDSLLPARIRRLSNAEYGASLAAMVRSRAAGPGTSAAFVASANEFAANLAPDARQDGFTVNDGQRVDAVLVRQLYKAAERVGADATKHVKTLAPCEDLSATDRCARAFIADFGSRAYRRPLEAEESTGLFEVYKVGGEDGGYADGIGLVVQAVLQSAGFLYLTELGSASRGASGEVVLSADEIASELSFLFTGAPPDEALRKAAKRGALKTPAGRVAQAERLRREHPGSEQRLVRMIHEWLELDKLESIAKDTQVYPRFQALKPEMLKENHAFVAAVLADDGPGTSDLTELIGANWTVAGPRLAQLYQGQARAEGRLFVPARLGLLNRAGFLSVQAHAHESTPVLRGVRVAKRLACQAVPSPSSVKIEVVAPVPDPKLTTRERFAAHSTTGLCATCHHTIDTVGNAFEQFDGMGAYRSQENGRAVDSSTTIALGDTLSGEFADSNALARALASSTTVRECFARHMFRSMAARSGLDAEDVFVAQWQTLPEQKRGNLMDILLSFVESPLFTHRGAKP
ncbi:MAG: hypothetical protein RLZZ450_5011 [Pseudomonadota bacterium]|jgi:hypothetical protein